MSENNDEFQQKVAEAAALEKRKKEVQAKELAVKERRLDNELSRIEQNDRELEISKQTNYGITTEDEIKQLQKESEEYILAARKCMVFINEEFNGVIPYFRKNLILIGGKTGEGKSTTVANVIASTIRQTNPATGKRCRVLVLTNEEKREDVFNRVTCLSKGWHYTNHDKFTDEQIKTFSQYIDILSRGSLVKVIDDTYGSTKDNPVSGVTTSIEGIKNIFDGLIRDNEQFDAILFDYYQNCKFSKKNPYLNEWEVQAQLAALLDQYKNILPCPIIILAQVTPPDAEKKTPFKTRIEGRKVILNVCTCCVEMVADRENLRTEWTIHKSRFNESIGRSFFTGYDNGRFVPYTIEFQAKVSKMQADRQKEYFDKKIGHMPTKKEEENGRE